MARRPHDVRSSTPRVTGHDERATCPRRDQRPDLGDDDEEYGDAAEAKAKAEADLAETEAQWAKVHKTSARLRAHRDANHFGDTIANIMKGGTA
jgi:hypothetical protein